MPLSTVNKEGLKSFSDRAIAVSYITLIFTFSVPKFTSFNYDPRMDFTKLAPHLATFSVSFVTIAAFWIAQSRLFNFIEHVNTAIVWYYRAYFVGLVLISVSAVSLSSDPFATLPLMVYTSFLLLTAIFHLCLLYSALNATSSDKNSTSNRLIKTIKKNALVGPACYLLALSVCYVSVYISFLAIITAMFFYLFFMRKIKQRITF